MEKVFNGRWYEDRDWDDLKEWWESYAMPPVPKDHLPLVGWIVPGSACSFLYQTDSSLCWIENLVCSPHVRNKERREAINEINFKLTEAAEILGFKSIFIFTKHPAVVQRATALGFKRIDGDYSCLVRR